MAWMVQVASDCSEGHPLADATERSLRDAEADDIDYPSAVRAQNGHGARVEASDDESGPNVAGAFAPIAAANGAGD